jgi:hypothetical protein
LSREDDGDAGDAEEETVGSERLGMLGRRRGVLAAAEEVVAKDAIDVFTVVEDRNVAGDSWVADGEDGQWRGEVGAVVDGKGGDCGEVTFLFLERGDIARGRDETAAVP